jgi:hypothetical protein
VGWDGKKERTFQVQHPKAAASGGGNLLPLQEFYLSTRNRSL